MSQHDMVLDDATGAAFRTDANAALKALESRFSGASAPTDVVQGKVYVKEVSSSIQEVYEYDGTSWVLVYTIDRTNHKCLGVDGTRRAWGGTAGGTGNALTISTTLAISAYENGQVFACILSADNTSATVTLNVDGVGATSVKVAGADPAVGALANGQVAVFEYGNSVLTLLNPSLTAYSPVGKHKIPVPASAMRAQSSNGPAAADVTASEVQYYVLDFDGSADEFAHFNIPMPSSWDEGTITFVPIWTAASGSGNVIWKLEGLARGNDDAISGTFSGGQTSTDTLLTAGDVHRGPESAAITIAGTPAANDIVFFRVSRDADAGGDTLNAVDARLIGIELYITTNAAVDVA
jgi:hypothetical protein